MTLPPAPVAAVSARQPSALFFLLAVALYAACVAWNTWVTDDAYISFRIVDNAVNGYGLTWNTDERVQSFTNPLWVLLHIPVYALTGDIFTATVLISLACSLAAFVLILRPYRHRPLYAAAMVVSPLLLSTASIYYATSGLETPLTFLLLALFTRRLLQGRRQILPLAFIAALAGVNRLDTLLLYLPALAWLLAASPTRAQMRALCAGSAPLLLWLAFSLFYFGFLFPNTRYAKLATGVPCALYLEQGVYYFYHLVRNDLITAVYLITAACVALYDIAGALRRQEGRGMAALWLGMLLYIAYTFAVGGDFMSGRFFAAPCLLAVILLAHRFREARMPAWGWPALLAAQAALSGVTALTRDERVTDPYFISSERRYYADVSPFSPNRFDLADHAWAAEGRNLARQAAFQREKKIVALYGSIGLFGFYAGPEVFIVDGFALADPLLARMPTVLKFFRIGHFWRDPPEGYMHARETGDTSRMDPALAQYYEKLRLIISGPLLSPERLLTILAFNLGAYDGFLKDYVERHRAEYFYLHPPSPPAIPQ